MRIVFIWAVATALAASAQAAELSFHFGGYALGQPPQGFQSALAGEGKPGDWRIVEDEQPSALQRISENAPVTAKHRVLAQVSQDPTDERFPITYYNGDNFGDFTLTTRLKLVSGAVEQMAGVAFRMQDEKNFYVIRLSGLGHNVKFYKVVSGLRSIPIGADLPITNNVWYALKIECKGNQIRCWLNDQEVFPPLTDNSFVAGKLGFWTKSDSVSYFGDSEMVYTPRVPFAQVMINDVMKQQPRLRGVKIFTPEPGTGNLRVIGSNNAKDIGQAGTKIEEKTFKTDAIFQAKGDGQVTAVVPLHDRNGETVAVVHLLMETFPGQTEKNVIARTVPITKFMQLRINSAKDLTE